jgi:glyoxylase-like metal-dependent hydrolase (beta-lactamase superfamily II)
MTNYICATCGTQLAETDAPPAHCPICEDERQYIGPNGQQWTTLEALQCKHHTSIKTEEPGLIGIGVEPSFAIGQRALLVQAPDGNILWDCITLIDDAAVAAVRGMGGIKAIAISHPHYYGSMIEWSRAFDNAPIYIHEAERPHVMRPDPAVHFWNDETLPLGDRLTLIRCGGHFEGAQVLHWAAGAEGHGVLLTGDIINVIPDRRFVSFLYSYPNQIPLNAAKVRHIEAAVAPFAFDRIYGAWWDRMLNDAKAAVTRSADRYVKAIAD